MTIEYLAGNRLTGIDGCLVESTLELTTDSHRVASSLHNTFSNAGAGGQSNWYAYSSDSSGYRGAQQYTASEFS